MAFTGKQEDQDPFYHGVWYIYDKESLNCVHAEPVIQNDYVPWKYFAHRVSVVKSFYL